MGRGGGGRGRERIREVGKERAREGGREGGRERGRERGSEGWRGELDSKAVEGSRRGVRSISMNHLLHVNKPLYLQTIIFAL